LQSYKEHKKFFIYSISLLSSFTLFYFILFFIFIPKPCAGQPDGGVGARDKTFVLQVA
jgi:hypothetical protein